MSFVGTVLPFPRGRELMVCAALCPECCVLCVTVRAQTACVRARESQFVRAHIRLPGCTDKMRSRVSGSDVHAYVRLFEGREGRAGDDDTNKALQERIALSLSIGMIQSVVVKKTSANSAPVIVEVSIPAQAVSAADLDTFLKRLSSRALAPLEPEYTITSATQSVAIPDPPLVDRNVPSSAPTAPPRTEVPSLRSAAPTEVPSLSEEIVTIPFPLPQCTDRSADCKQWAEQGDCVGTARAYMELFCRKSCTACANQGATATAVPSAAAACEDLDKANCGSWARLGLCTGETSALIQPACQLSCGLCGDQPVRTTGAPVYIAPTYAPVYTAQPFVYSAPTYPPVTTAVPTMAFPTSTTSTGVVYLTFDGNLNEFSLTVVTNMKLDIAAMLGVSPSYVQLQFSAGSVVASVLIAGAGVDGQSLAAQLSRIAQMPGVTIGGKTVVKVTNVLPETATPWIWTPPAPMLTPVPQFYCEVHQWQPWTACSTTCGVGFRTRERMVIVPLADSGFVPLCPLNYEMDQGCTQTPCPTPSPLVPTPVPSAQPVCIVGDWQPWFPCSVTCGSGERVRVRGINFMSGNFQQGVNWCPSLTESAACSISCFDTSCKVSPWTPWTQCKCGGTATRTRSIVQNSEPSSGCPNLADSFSCPECARVCPVSEWSPLSPCSASCGAGLQTRTRSVIAADTACIDTAPTLALTVPCNERSCNPVCQPSPWSQWTPCSQSCGGGSKSRERYSIVTSASCPRETDSNTCNESPCSADCVMSQWSEWSSCSKSCEGGSQRRFRAMIAPPENLGAPCGGSVEIQSCEWVVCPAPLTPNPTLQPTPATSAPRALADLMAECPKWAVQGECIANPVFMNVKCSFSCQVQAPIDPPTPVPTGSPSQLPSPAPKDSGPGSSMQFFMDLSGQIDDFTGDTLDAIKAFLVDFWQVKSSVVNLRLWAGSVVIAVTLTGSGINTAGLADQFISAFMAGQVRAIQGWSVRRMTVLNPDSRAWMFDPNRSPAPSLSSPPASPPSSPPSDPPSTAPTLHLPLATITNGLINSNFQVVYPYPRGAAATVPGWDALDGARLQYDFSKQVHSPCLLVSVARTGTVKVLQRRF